MSETVTIPYFVTPTAASILLTLVLAVGAWIVHTNHVAWENRGFERFTGQWWTIYSGSAAVGLLAAVVAEVRSNNPALFLIFGILGFVFSFTGYTDLYSRLAPIEISHLGLYTTFPIAIFGILSGDFGFGGKVVALERTPYYLPYEQLTQLGLYAAIIPIGITILALIAGGGVGLGDLRALWVITFALSWWYGFEWMIGFTLVSMVLQLLAGIPAHFLGWGEMRKAPFKGLRKLVNGIYGRITHSDKILWPEKSRAIAWLPALAVTFIVAPLIFL